MLKKVGVVAAAAIGMSLLAGPAIASASPAEDIPGMLETTDVNPNFADAYNSFIVGGGALGYGAASLVAGAYTGLLTSPALIAQQFGGE